MTDETIITLAIVIFFSSYAITGSLVMLAARERRRLSSHLALVPLRPDQYRRVAEWDYGPQEGVDWARYEREMSEPQWLHFGIYQAGEFVGALSLEKINDETTEYHVATGRRKIHPRALADLLISVGEYLFNHGFTRIIARIPKQKRAAVRLALRCGMIEAQSDESNRNFIMTREEFYGRQETSAG